MRYIYLKLGRSNRQLKYCLQIDGINNIFRRPIVYIFFGKITTERCKSLFDLPKNELHIMHKEDKKIPTYTNLHYQIKPFIEAGENRDVRFISIFENRLFIFEPDSEVFDMSTEMIYEFCADLTEKRLVEDEYIKQIKNDIPKIMNVKNLKIFTENIPYILRTINVIQYFNRGTCREIKANKNWEIIQALKTILNEERDLPEKITSQQLFKLLSPHQFETLIFLILTNANLYSPAWRAGSMPDIDIIGINYSDSEIIKLGNNPIIIFEKGKEVTFQVKRKEVKNFENADYIITLNPSMKGKYKNNRILSSEWLLNVVEKKINTKQWLENSLKWFLENTAINSIFDLLN